MRTLILALLTVFTVNAFAQEKPLITEAILKIRKNDIVEAKKNIDEASAIIDNKGEGAVDPKQMSKFLYNKGLIYQRISVSQDATIQALDPNALDIATDAYVKLLDYEKRIGKERFTADATQQLAGLTNAISNRAFNKNDVQDFTGAAADFLRVVDIKKMAFGKLDSTSYYYAGITYIAAEDYTTAAKILTELIDMNYAGHTFSADVVTPDGGSIKQSFPSRKMMEMYVEQGKATNPTVGPSVRPEIYKSLLQAYQKMEDTENFKTSLQKARTDYPNDVDFINIELQGYLDNEEFDKALEILEAAITSNPDNALYYYVKGFIYQTNVKDNEKALEAYAMATEKDPGSFDSWFMSGVVWYDQGKATIEKMNQLGLSKADQKKYETLKVEKENYFTKSLPFFEKAYEINNEDIETIKALWEVYRQTGNHEKVMEMKNKMDELIPAE